jgi:hypothetical protein
LLARTKAASYRRLDGLQENERRTALVKQALLAANAAKKSGRIRSRARDALQTISCSIVWQERAMTAGGGNAFAGLQALKRVDSGVHPTPPGRSEAGKTAGLPLKATSAVDKPLHIHKTRCAEQRLLKTTRFFSNIGASSIQSLSSSFVRT